MRTKRNQVEVEAAAPRIETSKCAAKFHFQRFDDESEEWEIYIQRFEIELMRQGIPNDQKVRAILLLSSVGPTAFKILVNHFKPLEIRNVAYSELKQQLNKFYVKEILIFAERRQFVLRIRQPNETVRDYVNILKSLAAKCDYGRGLEEHLRDQLVIGINCDAWQQEIIRLHPSNEATLKDVEATAYRLEQAQEHQSRLKTLTFQDIGAANKVTTPDVSNKEARKQQQRVLELVRGTHCFQCGSRAHRQGRHCPAEGQTCFLCNVKGHFSRTCIKKGRAKVLRSNRAAQLGWESGSSASGCSSSSTAHQVCAMDLAGRKAMLDVGINGKRVEMLYDPGATHTVIGRATWQRIGSPALKPTGKLVAYTEIPITTLGKCNVSVEAFGKLLQLPVCVIQSNDIPLFGLDWSLAFAIPLPPGARLCNIQSTTQEPEKKVGELLVKYREIFDRRVGTIKGHKAVIHVQGDPLPKLCKPRPVPFALREKVELELERLQREGIIERVDTSQTPIEWASPLVIATKPDGRVRLCADFKGTINPHIGQEHHPIPRFEEVLDKLRGGEEFSIIDLKDAYLQLEVEENSRKFLVVSTCKGYFTYRRLPFGIKLAPALFQKTMDHILSGLSHVACYLDDIIVTGPTREKHLARLGEVLDRLARNGIRVKQEKCRWLEKSVIYLGHRIDAEGVHPTSLHVQAVKSMPSPSNVSELRSFLGAINYYSRFIRNMQPMCAPLHMLCQKGVRWEWTDEHERVVQQLKDCLTSSDTLVHYQVDVPVIVSADASEKGIGAVMWHRYPDGTERPISFASRTLTNAESRYSSIDREALALIFAVTRFHQYLYGREFVLRTDHKPLLRILGEACEIPKMAANRLARWAMTLSSYSYKIEHVQGKNNAPADALSRLPINTSEVSDNEAIGKVNMGNLLNLRLHELTITKKTLRSKTCSDPDLQLISRYIQNGWPSKKDMQARLTTFFEKREEMSLEEGIILWKGRILVPESLRKHILNILHEGHPGIGSMRALAHFHVWWPRIDKDIDNYLKKCTSCQEARPKEVEAPLSSWTVPTEPWARIHVDFAGPFEGKHWFIVVDAFTKWLEIKQMTNTSTASVINVLRELFVRYGLPRHIVSDNGPQFVSSEFSSFCSHNGVVHIRSTPYHPKTNGLAERAVRTFKYRMRAAERSEPQVVRLQKFLFAYRNSPHFSTGRAPAELMMGRRLRTRLDLLKPDVLSNIDGALVRQKVYHDRKAKPRFFDEGEEVWVLNSSGRGYSKGKIIRKTGYLSYQVLLNGREQRKHADQLKRVT